MLVGYLFGCMCVSPSWSFCLSLILRSKITFLLKFIFPVRIFSEKEYMTWMNDSLSCSLCQKCNSEVTKWEFLLFLGALSLPSHHSQHLDEDCHTWFYAHFTDEIIKAQRIKIIPIIIFFLNLQHYQELKLRSVIPFLLY